MKDMFPCKGVALGSDLEAAIEARRRCGMTRRPHVTYRCPSGHWHVADEEELDV